MNGEIGCSHVVGAACVVMLAVLSSIFLDWMLGTGIAAVLLVFFFRVRDPLKSVIGLLVLVLVFVLGLLAWLSIHN